MNTTTKALLLPDGSPVRLTFDKVPMYSRAVGTSPQVTFQGLRLSGILYSYPSGRPRDRTAGDTKALPFRGRSANSHSESPRISG